MRNILVWILALVLAAIFAVAGGWKLWAPAAAGIRLVQLGIPSNLGLPLAVVLGTAELFAAVLLVIPAYRRWGAALIGVMLVVFMAYMGARYTQLKGVECGCLPGRGRALGAGFFIQDGLMLAAAAAVFLLKPLKEAPRRSLVPAALALALIVALGVGSASLERPLFAKESGLTVRVMDRAGRVADTSISSRSQTLLYFYDATCSDCKKASAELARVRLAAPLIALPIEKPQEGYAYLDAAGIKNALISPDHAQLSERFQAKQVPAVYIVQGAAPQNAIFDFERSRFEKVLRDGGLLLE